MNTSQDWLQQLANDYNTLTKNDKKIFLEELYVKQELSVLQIVKKYNLLYHTVNRDIKRLGIPRRSMSSISKQARDRCPEVFFPPPSDTETNIKKAQGMKVYWDGLDEETRKNISDQKREEWNNKSPQELEEFNRKSRKAIQAAAIHGSKLEHILQEFLLQEKHKVEFHREHLVINEKVHLDIFLPSLNTVIEVDGPSHFKNVWGEKELARVQKTDALKNGLLLGRGMTVIRVRHTGELTKIFVHNLKQELHTLLEKITTKDTNVCGRLHYIGTTN